MLNTKRLDWYRLKYEPVYTLFLIDRSGSMVRHTQEVIGVYDAAIDVLRKRPAAKRGSHFITTVLFSEDLEVIQELEKLSPKKGKDRIIDLKEGLPPEGNFYPSGRTALYDCLYEALGNMLQVLNILTMILLLRISNSSERI